MGNQSAYKFKLKIAIYSFMAQVTEIKNEAHY